MLLLGLTSLLGFMLVSAVQCQSATDERCSAPVSVAIESSRNQTGQWSTKVGLEHRKTSGPWLVTTDVCEGKDTVRIMTIISRTGSPKAFPAGYHLFPDIGYYKLHPNGTTWHVARQTCADEGAHLAIINSEKEADVMVQMFARLPKAIINAGGNDVWAWVGVHEMGVNGAYHTVFGEPLAATGFMRWFPSQPDDKGVNDAVVTHRDTGGLGDAAPTWIATFICEMEL